ncbi:MAG: B12-binding domain-containing radical SAM protein [Deltaproteobacteria bacterium]|nr:B12-binding domain-containing radical SAM protein [Deltaproteobacteria bacterium]HPW68059.1 radical SAM protein [Deltaproteobacteria bacterium]
MWDETGAIRKDPGGRLNIALVYPNTYWVGMSNLGLHAMYRVFNGHPSIACERFFTDSPRSVESSRSLQDFHIIAFSVSYELDWINMIRILLDNRIPVRREERRGGPIVMAGGAAATINPEPVAEALDFCFLGEGEPLGDALANAFFASDGYQEFLDRLAGVPGIYLPERTCPVYEGERIREFAGPRPVISVVRPFDNPGHSVILTDKTVFQDMFLTEIARGCPFNCKFCTAREIYSPFRPVDVDRLLPVLDRAVSSGRKLGLVSTSLNNHPRLPRLLEEIDARGLKIAPPSLRLGMISGELLAYMKASKVNEVTLAPEVGSDTLRAALGKQVSREAILEDVISLVRNGIRDIKLYFMVGLPGEEQEDMDAAIDLVKRIRQTFIQVSRGNRRIGRVSVSINTMIPKPHSRYERAALLEPGKAKNRIKKIVKGLQSQSNVTVSFEGPKWAYIQTLIARGDRRVLDLLTEMAARDPSKWQEVLRNWPRNPDYYALREHGPDEILPWSFYSLFERGRCPDGGGEVT